MTQLTLVTGNLDKLTELQAVFPPEVELTHRKLDIVEIQGEPSEIVIDKLQRAYEAVKGPVIVEDVSAELACHNGLPDHILSITRKSWVKMHFGSLPNMLKISLQPSVVLWVSLMEVQRLLRRAWCTVKWFRPEEKMDLVLISYLSQKATPEQLPKCHHQKKTKLAGEV